MSQEVKSKTKSKSQTQQVVQVKVKDIEMLQRELERLRTFRKVVAIRYGLWLGIKDIERKKREKTVEERKQLRKLNEEISEALKNRDWAKFQELLSKKNEILKKKREKEKPYKEKQRPLRAEMKYLDGTIIPSMLGDELVPIYDVASIPKGIRRPEGGQ